MSMFLLSRCDCPVGLTGARCEVDIDECKSWPCQNDATCLNDRGRYICICMPGKRTRACRADVMFVTWRRL